MTTERWSIAVSAEFERDLRHVSTEMRQRVRRALEDLAQLPEPWPRLKRIEGRGNTWRLRVGDYRVLLETDVQHQTLRLMRVRHRCEAYR